MAENDEIIWDAEFMDSLPPAAQRRIIRLTCDLMEAQVCQEYNLPPGSLIGKVGDPVKKDLDPEAFRDELERAALSHEPLPRDMGQLWELHQEKLKGEQDGEE